MRIKKCVECKGCKPLDNYWKCKRRNWHDGLDDVCSDCRILAKQRYQSTPQGLYEAKARLLLLAVRDLWFPDAKLGDNIDHIFSIKAGFDHKVELKYVTAKHNLQILSKSDNCRKGSQCWISLEQLHSTYVPDAKFEALVQSVDNMDAATIRKHQTILLEKRKQKLNDPH